MSEGVLSSQTFEKIKQIGSEIGIIINNVDQWLVSATKISDMQVQRYLIGAKTDEQCENRASSFLASLFQELSKADFKSLSHMAGYLGYGNAGKWSQRKAFFDAVILQAHKIEVNAPLIQKFRPLKSPILQRGIQPQTPAPPGKDRPFIPLLDQSDKLPSQAPLKVKLLLGFDESSNLADPWKDWDAFEKICRIFWYLRLLPMFGVFVSTNTSARKFNPASRQDKSLRIQDGTLFQNAPITSVDYDQLAMKLKPGQTLDNATTMDYMVSLGRPLFKTRYDAMKSFKPPYYNGNDRKLKSDIIHFATHKLLNGQGKYSDLHISLAPLGHKATILEARAYKGRPPLGDVFKDSWTHCTHFVKVTDRKVIRGKELVTGNIAAIVFQSKNVTDLDKPDHEIFVNMARSYSGIFDNDPPDDILPIVQLVLSVGTQTSALTCPPWRHPRQTRSKSSRSKRSKWKDMPLPKQHFRFFATGISHKVFRPIREEDEAIWRALLWRSGVDDIYDHSGDESILRRMTPGAQSDPKHWEVFFPLDTL
ncbi:hypothetical protein JB92DRAFT_2832325 [Gautieria morchelliformis]|nr:hypothetical protein JB92DRAFT_2832325 [Gautieria morchelliformis]